MARAESFSVFNTELSSRSFYQVLELEHSRSRLTAFSLRYFLGMQAVSIKFNTRPPETLQVHHQHFMVVLESLVTALEAPTVAADSRLCVG